MKKINKLVSIFGSTMVLGSLGANLLVNPFTVNAQDAVAGEFTLYTSQPEEDVAKLVEAFNAEYPDVKVNVFRSGTEEVISKLQAEKQTDNLLADVLLVSDSFTFKNLVAQDLLQPYESPELAEINEVYVDADHYYTGTKIIVTGIAVNTEMADASTIKGFSSLTDESLKGQVMIPSPLYSGAASLNLSIQVQQENIGWDFYEALKTNEVFVGKGNGTVRDALLNGEKAVGILVDYMANRAKNDGAPIEFIYPEEGALFVTEPIGLIKDTPNQAVAEKFIDFVLSEAGQTVASEMGYTPVRNGVKAPEGLLGAEEISPIEFDAEKVIETRDADKEKFAEIFGAAE